MNIIKEYLNKHGIYPFGLYGDWIYYWSDQSFMKGMSFGKKFKHFKRDIILKGYINGIIVNNFGTFVNFVLSLFYPLIRFYKKNEFD